MSRKEDRVETREGTDPGRGNTTRLRRDRWCWERCVVEGGIPD